MSSLMKDIDLIKEELEAALMHTATVLPSKAALATLGFGIRVQTVRIDAVARVLMSKPYIKTGEDVEALCDSPLCLGHFILADKLFHVHAETKLGRLEDGRVVNYISQVYITPAAPRRWERTELRY